MSTPIKIPVAERLVQCGYCYYVWLPQVKHKGYWEILARDAVAECPSCGRRLR